ncbi:hypothetical protein O3M35_000418 [Rhynocoris fuscipes]|uniref:Uncharacterized protein n=1 Tax=Rhynocoris fuscipes TaxID=488301 RepID=A0AAW1DLG9_9HEMI
MNDFIYVDFNYIDKQLKICPNTGLVKEVIDKSEKINYFILNNVKTKRNLDRSTQRCSYNDNNQDFMQKNSERKRFDKTKDPLYTSNVSKLGYYLGQCSSTSTYPPRILNKSIINYNNKIKAFDFKTPPPDENIKPKITLIHHGMRKCRQDFGEIFKINESVTNSVK